MRPFSPEVAASIATVAQRNVGPIGALMSHMGPRTRLINLREQSLIKAPENVRD